MILKNVGPNLSRTEPRTLVFSTRFTAHFLFRIWRPIIFTILIFGPLLGFTVDSGFPCKYCPITCHLNFEFKLTLKFKLWYILYEYIIKSTQKYHTIFHDLGYGAKYMCAHWYSCSDEDVDGIKLKMLLRMRDMKTCFSWRAVRLERTHKRGGTGALWRSTCLAKTAIDPGRRVGMESGCEAQETFKESLADF